MTACRNDSSAPSVAVLGGGLAGITAAWSARQAGCRVTLFERGRHLGGRIASLEVHASLAQAAKLLDNGEHIWLAACLAVDKLFQELELKQYFDLSPGIHFACGGGHFWSLNACRWLPRRFALLPSLMRLPNLTFRERCHLIHIARLLLNAHDDSLAPFTFSKWYNEQGGRPRPAQFFWQPLILSSLSDMPDQVSALAVKKIILEGVLFCSGKNLGLYLPNLPLREIFHDAVFKKFQEEGIDVRFHSRITQLLSEGPRITAVCGPDGGHEPFDAVINATGPFAAAQLFADSGLDAELQRIAFERFELGAITTVHLWLDRPITKKKAIALTGTPGQWLFANRGVIASSELPWYAQILISGSHRLLDGSELTSGQREQLAHRIFLQLQEQFPHAKAARLMASRVSTILDAVISPSPESFGKRPGCMTAFDNLFLAGDWTDTHWPSTMEAAVRSGRLAVESLLAQRNRARAS
ncbi:MAG: hydroxysqualene dehydroxylase HpnE [Planctomycetia bacterium]|nr:hydroxysqualene dehydroxylase HpnE [Planctomycetia bacterium]